ncbi:kinetoplast DNA-associated protein [Trypanosoma theileri]|uniref:Kinetoplast DNA-associated protein n=1 Tax=Trypanosoma theileri TaxID=67003 RepID=A0A1X0P0T5_9TRYP|nr:kinetoplast DNA-associated protein [Trypanosoma theileri]ORC90448.1 kinetoplast DNA-associated protein [Trypanosoma theileri]
MPSTVAIRSIKWSFLLCILWILLRIWRRVAQRRIENVLPLYSSIIVKRKVNGKITDRPITGVSNGTAHNISAVGKSCEQKQQKGQKNTKNFLGKKNINKTGERVVKEIIVNDGLELASATPFLGFSLVDNIRKGTLLVDGLFQYGPAYNVGVRIDDELVEVNGIVVKGIEHARELVRTYCVPGTTIPFVFRRSGGEPFAVKLGVMTAERRFSGTEFYYDPTRHDILESKREKNECWSWRNLR